MHTLLEDKYINFFTDYGFKRLFGEERNKDLLIDFLNNLLDKKETIVTLNFKNTEKTSSSKLDRKAIFDLYCENDKGEKFIIELQKAKQNYFKDRSLFYSTFPIQEQAKRGDWNFELKAVYTIGILDFCFDDNDKNKTVVSEVKLFDIHTKKIFYDKLTFIYLQMPNFTKKENELETYLDKWLFAIKNLHTLSDKPRILNGIFEKFFEEAKISNYSQKEIHNYENSLKYYRDLKNSFDTVLHEGLMAGRIEGRIEGRVEGRVEGRIETEEKLKPIIEEQNQAIIESAKLMKKAGISIENIQKATNLLKEVIERL